MRTGGSIRDGHFDTKEFAKDQMIGYLRHMLLDTKRGLDFHAVPQAK